MNEWATRVPGVPFRWVLNLASEERAPVCPVHDALTDEVGVCEECLAALGWSGRRCRVCGLPLHPAVQSGGAVTHPSCDRGEEETP
jgi:predicted amidophosphoribosyltransferase